MTVIHQITFVVAAAALAGAGFRVATLTGAAGLPRVVATAVFGAALAALEALGLGLVSLGGSTIALAVAAVLTWLVARRLAPDEGTPAREEFRGWWASAPIAPRVALATGAGAWLVWTVWLVRHPILGADSMIYHVPEVVEWIHNGRPGSVSGLFPGYPVGAYPVTNEVLLEWSSALSRSFVPVMVWAPVTLALLATAGWTGLRTLRVPRLPAGLAVLTLCLMPPLTHWQKNGAHTDLPALAWLVCAAALCAASVSRPKLLTGVVLAAALAIGTKTTTLPLGLLVLAIAAVVHRHRLSGMWRPLAVACGVGLAVGGYWYLRNLVLHGSPLWPFVATPWGDPVPAVIAPSGDVVEQVYTRFLDTPRRTAEFLLSDWAKPFAGGYLLIAGALLAPLATRTRAVLASTAVTALSLLLWMNAPFTGISEGDAGSSALTTVRYLLPTFTVGALTICLAARERPYGRPYAVGALTLALGFTASQLFDLGYPSAPPVAIVVAGALGGAALVGVAALLPRRNDWPRLARVAAVPAIVIVGLLLSVAASGFVGRFNVANVSESSKFASAAPAMFDWFLLQPEWVDGDSPVAFSVVMNAALAGDRLQHRIDLVDALDTCREVDEHLRKGWVIVNRSWPNPPCYGGLTPRWKGGEFEVYGGEAPDGR